MHSERVVAALQVRIPPLVVVAVYLLALAAMFPVGAQSGYAESRYLVALVLLLLALSTVLYLIVDLDRPQEGLLQVSQQALVDLQGSLSSYP